MTARRFVVPAEAAGERLDQFLAARDVPFSRSQLKRRIENGEVTVNGEPGKPARKLRAGDVVAFDAEPPRVVDLVAEDLPLVVLHEDQDLIVIDKPAGLVVHPAAGHERGTLVNALLHHCTDLAGIGGELRPGIVHRLDKDTSGVMVASKNDETHAALTGLFKKKDLTREYVAIVAPAPTESRGTIRTRYGRHPVHRKRFTSRVPEGKLAVTHYEVHERLAGGAALVVCRLDTGRTHQIRVHMADSGWPVLGDRTYGKPPRDPLLRTSATLLGRQALHARRLAFLHPRTGLLVDCKSEPPPDMQTALGALRPRAPDR